MNSGLSRQQALSFCKLAIILLLFASLDAAAQWQQGFDFRNTPTFVTDPSGDTYVGPTTAYPTKNNEGTFGWVKTSLVQARDRSTAVDPRLAGINFANNGAPATLLLGVCVGVPMTAVTMYTGQTFGARSAAPLTFLNFSWSAGALAAPLLAARLLTTHTFRAAYVILAGAALLAALACRLLLEDPPEPAPAPSRASGVLNLPIIALFAFLTFLQVGVENTTASWLATFVLRTAGTGASLAAAASSLYWAGFLASRGVSSLLLLRVSPVHLLRLAIILGLAASMMLVSVTGTAGHVIAMVILGAALAPIFPLLLAYFFAQARQSSDSRWVLSLCGFGGSVLPWVAGSVSAHTGSLRLGLVVIPAALLVIFAVMPLIRAQRSAAPAQ